jgi:hypothetical protein
MRILGAMLTACLLVAGRAGAEPPAAPPLEFSGERAFELLVHQVEFGPRVPGTEPHAKMLAWMADFLREQNAEVTPHTFQVADVRGEGSLRLTNLKASLAVDREPRVALAAHWDSRPVADRQPGGPVDQPIPGANDGASGVAVLLTLAELLSDQDLPVGVDLLFFDGEDYGHDGFPGQYCLGSRQFVADFPAYRPKALILLDMVGDADLRIPMEATSLYHAQSLVQTVFNRAAALGLPAFDPVPGPAVTDDHVAFLQAGIAAVDLIDLDYAAWHTLEDAPDQCSPESLAQVGQLLVALIFTDFAP